MVDVMFNETLICRFAEADLRLYPTVIRYESVYATLFKCSRLNLNPYRCRFTEADLRLYPTIIRYDSVYTTLFKCSRQRVSDYPALARWRKDVYNLGVASPGMQVNRGWSNRKGKQIRNYCAGIVSSDYPGLAC